MVLHVCGLNTNRMGKELQPHGTKAFSCAGYDEDSRNTLGDFVPWHWHEEFEIVYVPEGAIHLQVLNEHFKVRQGELAIINANALHMAQGAPHARLYSMVFSPALVNGAKDSAFAVKYMDPLINCHQFKCILFARESSECKKMVRYFQEAFYALRDESFAYEFTVRDCLSRLLLAVYLHYSKFINTDPLPENLDSVRITKMLNCIHQNYKITLSLEDIANSATISEREALRCFKRTIGESPIQYLLKYRLIQAASMLKVEPTKSVAAIAMDCGFDSPAYFAKKFKELYSTTPKAYRSVSP